MNKHIARFLPAAQFDTLAGFVRGKFADDLDLQLALFTSVQEGAAQRGLVLRGTTREWFEVALEPFGHSRDQLGHQ